MRKVIWYEVNSIFIKTLVSALKINNSFSYTFDSLKSVAIETSPDTLFRIFSWHIMDDDGSYRYYGTIQMNMDDTLKMFPLTDRSAEVTAAGDSRLTSEQWLGAQYYEIIPVTQDIEAPYYILLGWKGKSPRSTQRVIEVLQFKDNKRYFCLPVFYGQQEYEGKYRILFEYSRQASMMLRFLKEERSIIFDHLAPFDDKLLEKLEFYGPDLTYDCLNLRNGRWEFTENVKMKNLASEADDLFVDPKKTRPETINKLKY